MKGGCTVVMPARGTLVLVGRQSDGQYHGTGEAAMASGQKFPESVLLLLWSVVCYGDSGRDRHSVSG